MRIRQSQGTSMFVDRAVSYAWGMYVASARRMVLVGLCWLGITVAVCGDPRAAVAFPVTAPLFLVAILGSVTEVRAAYSSKEQLSPTQRHTQVARPVLLLLASCSVAGAIASVVPSLEFRSEGGDIAQEYGLSRIVAPALWALIFGASITAIVRSSPRRFALAAGVAILAWPLLLAIRALREPWFDIDDEYRVLAPWALHLFVAAAVVASGLALVLAFVSARAAARPMQLPTNASVISNG